MNSLPPRLKRILRLYCHVESRDIPILKDAIRDGRLADSETVKSQLSETLAASSIPLDEINRETGEEFETEGEARDWLRKIYVAVFEK